MAPQGQKGHLINLWLVWMVCLQSDVTTAVSPLDVTLVHQVTCTYHGTSLSYLRLLEAQHSASIVTYNNNSEKCLRSSKFSDCLSMSEYTSVKAVISDVEAGRGRVLTCVAEILQDQTYVNETLGNVTITGPATTSRWVETTPSTHTLTTGAVEARPTDVTRDNHGNQTTPVTSNCVDPGQRDTRVTSPLSVSVLTAVIVGLMLLAGLALLLALMLRREKRRSHSLLYRMPMDLPLHNSRLPVNANSYLPSPRACSVVNGNQTPPAPRLLARRRHLAVRRHSLPTDHDDVYLTPRTPECCPLTSDHYTECRSEEVRSWGTEEESRTNLPERCSNDLDDNNPYSSVLDCIGEQGEKVSSIYINSFY
ncbi:uncharacterized protein LOC112568829 [Pomacea canaliculata]|uniref:uncharacterized protein LOC112568829 n=1 Tax=Pomacea canaliculata TaxID=400727 RepID=UPI000D72F47A|nr:uncharacterized protein LOC112568829 [Pomacea canaliculata]XP_025102117.1 uncharacterized protein LOC112568829 [Pomacea canaliculata]XP_025102118.1 uncharacterized protein LOC112568829 [Pomacea canaliculata]XP_025102120.1 uncharacterized protein LOC112568829 [Pomacea canaliculata]XP_025102121.1 uncharacterized protein LOC112568829 [Pomacea canaliculata]